MLLAMQEWPQISAIEIGFDNGGFYFLSAFDQFTTEDRVALKAPETARFLEETIRRGDRDEARVIRRLLDADGNVLRTERSSDSDFDPRSRPWFERALATDAVTRTDVYTFARSGRLGLTVSRRHETGVVGIDITLHELAAFLSSAPQARAGVLAIFHPGGTVLASSTPGHATAAPTLSGLAIRQVEEGQSANYDFHQAAVLGAVRERLRIEPEFRTGVLAVDGEEWLADISEIGLGAAAEELLLVAMPTAVVVAPFERLARNVMLVSILLVVAFVPLIWLVSRRVSRPIVQLTASAEAIRRFEIANEPQPLSHVMEIDRLAEAMTNMRSHLRTFATYVPKALVRLWIERSETPVLGGTRREITVLFMDLENFTAMSADLAPEEVMQRMARYLEVVTQTLIAHEATIDKYIGDAVMAFWNAPLDTTDHVGKACSAALAVIEAARSETAGWSTPGPAVRTRIGVHCGEAIVGNVGSSDRMNYTALGATVNLAARLETLNRELGTDVLVSADVVERVRDRFLVEHVGSTVLKGFATPVEVYALIEPAAAEASRTGDRDIG
jgi:class 3 adenylate cyclase